MSADNVASAAIDAICFVFAVWALTKALRTGQVFTGIGYATRDGMPAAFRIMLVFYALLALIFGGAGLADALGISVHFFPLRIG